MKRHDLIRETLRGPTGLSARDQLHAEAVRVLRECGGEFLLIARYGEGFASLHALHPDSRLMVSEILADLSAQFADDRQEP